MKKKEQKIDAMKMVREIRDELGKLRREDPTEYFRQIEESGRKLLARRKRLSKKLNTNPTQEASKSRKEGTPLLSSRP